MALVGQLTLCSSASHFCVSYDGFGRRTQAMASYKSIAVVAAVLFVGATAQENTLAAVADLASNPNSAFVYVPQTSVTGEITVSCQVELLAGSHPRHGPPTHNCACAAQTGADSVTSLRTATYWPALTGLGISQSAFTLAPCTLRSPHIHERASGILYAAQGKDMYGQLWLYHCSKGISLSDSAGSAFWMCD